MKETSFEELCTRPMEELQSRTKLAGIFIQYLILEAEGDLRQPGAIALLKEQKETLERAIKYQYDNGIVAQPPPVNVNLKTANLMGEAKNLNVN